MYAPDKSPARLLVDGPAAGAWNMAVDEILLRSVAETSHAALRFYHWSEATLSLGYFQRFADRRQHPSSRDCPAVRRQTGGGAILHDRELTYCLVVPAAHPLAADPAWLYAAAHDAAASVLAASGIAARRLEAAEAPSLAREPFLCFQRRTRGDLVADGTKICGSAQRRSKGAILQHGSLLLAASPCAAELPGIAEVTGQRLNAERLVEPWAREIGQRARLALAAAPLTERELADVRTLTLEKYSATAWNHRR